ncbi:hypothetical protein ACF1X5_20085, partial [Klebsiella quasipneumoniae]
KGRDARKRAYCLKIQPATGSFARNLIYSTKPVKVATSCYDYGNPNYPIKDPIKMEEPEVCPK